MSRMWYEDKHEKGEAQLLPTIIIKVKLLFGGRAPAAAFPAHHDVHSYVLLGASCPSVDYHCTSSSQRQGKDLVSF